MLRYTERMQHARKGNAAPFSHAGSLAGSLAGFAHPQRNILALGIDHAMKVADFGAGSGAYAIAMARHLEGSGIVYALDIQKDLLRRLHNDAKAQGLKNIEILWADLEVPGGSKLSDGLLDLVLISNLLFQVEDKAAVLSEAKRIVKSGGRVAIIDWSESFGGIGPHPESVVTREAAYALAQEAGLTFQKEFSAGAHHYGLVFRNGIPHGSGHIRHAHQDVHDRGVHGPKSQRVTLRS